MANHSCAEGKVIIHKDFWNDLDIRKMLIDFFEEYKNYLYFIKVEDLPAFSSSNAEEDLVLIFFGNGRWSFSSTLDNSFKYGFEDFKNYDLFITKVKEFNKKDIYPIIFKVVDYEIEVGFHVEYNANLIYDKFLEFDLDMHIDALRGDCLSNEHLNNFMPLKEKLEGLNKYKNLKGYDTFHKKLNSMIDDDLKTFGLSLENAFIDNEFVENLLMDYTDYYPYEDNSQDDEPNLISTILPEPFYFTKAFGDIFINKKMWDTKEIRLIIEDIFLNLDFGKDSYFKIIKEEVLELDSIKYYSIEFEAYIPAPTEIRGMSETGLIILDQFFSFTDRIIKNINENLPNHKNYLIYKMISNTLLVNEQTSFLINYIEHDGFIDNYEISIFDDLEDNDIESDWYYSIEREFKRMDYVSSGQLPGFIPELELLEKLDNKYPENKTRKLKDSINEIKVIIENEEGSYWLHEENILKMIEEID